MIDAQDAQVGMVLRMWFGTRAIIKKYDHSLVFGPSLLEKRKTATVEMTNELSQRYERVPELED